ncbi:ABC transporter ATP-binding protein [Desertifilum sp. FACHB-1129]|uniref:Multidrug ABC transporter ATP-binding protein n=1 Tax=Desertifilum tharense IPPAS B-1220 TaxID=1781255 RepID=A0A1E5QDX4_9CYAN|nr:MULTISPECIES: ABC transporter ATP-binding protein [Desertifilum]MDA0209048.1 ABC transporter ATP-binding protein [Cyanobacteria bacterium FC1]MBD2310530.1 ABC transporter ATP-binding protein [Desertifilum sp. FACHB-1129]MBD2321982.1 ABC transporter ATP-binding protein [Desertifilum sp. FACHB-866]MBD2332109.1 ABC transporter ATP-binding protein [Desertifilum sp. FACHB-868]OEJ72837.1 multidrug ABC transporter ATP-binding protein [Desertifilum tharense IPPAS B-1220]
MQTRLRQPQTQPISLVAYDLWKEYGDRTVVQGVSFTLNPGEVLGVLGPNGAGKTTTVGMLYGSVLPTRGFVQIGDYQVQNQGREARSYLGIVTQEDNLDPDFTVFENLLHFAHHYRITGNAARARASELLAQVNLQDYAKNQVDELSGGMKRRLVLARALINQPSIIFLDEPTTGLDPDARQDFWKLVTQLKQGGAGVLLTTHYMDEAQRLCDRLLLMQHGRVVDEGTPTELIERTVGKEVIEVEGVDEQQLQQLASQYQTWYRSFGSGYLLGLPDNAIWEQLTHLNAPSLSRRPTNLEDVFLRLTGESLAQP